MREQAREKSINLESIYQDHDVQTRTLSSCHQSPDASVTSWACLERKDSRQGSIQRIDTAEQNNWLNGLLDALPLAVLVIDQEGIVRYSNQNVREYLGESMLGKVWRDFILDGRIVVNEDGEAVLPDDRKVLVSTKPLGCAPGQVIVLYDITGLSNMKSMAHRFDLSSLAGKINATLAHQIRTPLTSTLLYAGQLKNNIHDEKSRSCVDRIINNIKHLEKITQKLLGDITSVDERVEYVDARKIFTELHEVARPLADKANINLTVECGYEDVRIKCNRDMFKSILLNIVINAMQSCMEKRAGDPSVNGMQSRPDSRFYVRLSLNVADSGISEKITRIEVIDNGVGISQGDLETIFNPYYTTKIDGTGLGLSLAKTVIKAMGGSIIADRETSGGARFILDLPYHAGDRTDS